jgi:hypothetical protein
LGSTYHHCRCHGVRTQRGAPGQAALRLRYVQHAGGWYASPMRRYGGSGAHVHSDTDGGASSLESVSVTLLTGNGLG